MRRLNFFTDEFPYGNNEQFIVNELDFLSKHFDEIVIFPLAPDLSQVKRKLPENVKVIVISIDHSEKLKNKWQFYKLFLSEILSHFRCYASIAKMKKVYGQLKNNFIRAQKLTETNVVGFDDKNYSYWMYDWTVALGLLKQNGKINGYITRAHGGDLYNERRWLGIHPFRNFVLNKVDKVVSISHAGRNYLNERFPKFSSKITVSRLGTNDYGLNPKKSQNLIRIVSCSLLIPLKRVHLIAEALNDIHDLEIEWIHFGDGKEMIRIQELKSKFPKNIRCELKGMTTNADIMQYYKTNAIDFFISVSETEGIPYSFMEAISFGIPILSTNVGGVNEIVNETTGHLLHPDITKKELSIAIKDMALNSGVKFDRHKIRECWKNEFYSDNNFSVFYNEFLK